MTIRNLEDLCQFFSADEPRSLNRRIYKDTNCGASISILLTPEAYLALGPVEAWESFTCCGREYQGGPWNSHTPEGLAKTARELETGIATHTHECGQVHATHRTMKPLVVPERGAWIHNGDKFWDKLTTDTPIVDFTIQTIVEGIDATVDSEPFGLPVEGAVIEGWIAQMESEAADLWEEANDDDEENDEYDDDPEEDEDEKEPQ
jgi:hypothetical protein